MRTQASNYVWISFLLLLLMPMNSHAQTPPTVSTGNAATSSTYGGMWMGPGMMQNMGPGMMQNMGPGMMGGMMSACPMMGMMGMGPGMMGPNATTDPVQGATTQLQNIYLTETQKKRINSIVDSERKKHLDLISKIMDQQARLRDLSFNPTPEPKEVGAIYREIGKLQQQMAEMHVQAQNKVYGELTEVQQKQYRQWQGAK